MKKIRYLVGLFGALVLLIAGASPLIAHAAQETIPIITLSSNTTSVEVNNSQTMTLQADNLPTNSIITIDLPTGVTTDQDQLNKGLSSDQIKSTVSNNQLTLQTTDLTLVTVKIPIIASSAGQIKLQAQLGDGSTSSNVLVFDVTEPLIEESSSSSSNSSSTSQAVTSSSESTSTSSSSQSVSSESQDKSNDTKSSIVSSGNENTTKSSRAITISATSDQVAPGSGLTYVYFYNNNLGLTMTGKVQTATARNLYVSYSLVEVGQSASMKLLGRFQTQGSNVNEPYSFTIPSSAFPAFASNYGKVYSFRLQFSEGPLSSPGNTSIVNLRLVYAKGELTMQAPSNISFGENLDANFTTIPQLMGTITSNDKLTVDDTREIGGTVPYRNGWSVTATLAQQMTGQTSQKELTNSLHYLNNGTDYTLGSSAVPVYSKAHAEKETVDISKTWNENNGLAFEPTVGQPEAGEHYQGVVQWNLQETPSNS